MFLPLVDSLRCPHVHGQSWLVASIDRAEERDIVEGTLGCPVCLSEYQIREGIVFFTDNPARAEFRAPSEDEATLLAAALDLTEARMTAALHGEWGANAPIIRGLSPSQLLLVNPPVGIASGDGVSIVYADVAPLAPNSMSAAAFDASASDVMIESLIRSLRLGGRLLGPAETNIPSDFNEIARNDQVWVAQSGAPVSTPPIHLRRAGR